MKKVTINPGVCGLITHVEAESEDGMDVVVRIKSDCPSVQKMFAELGDTFDAFEVCLCRPGKNEFYEYAGKHFPGHAACPVCAGITKCIEAECKLALPRPAEIIFED